MFSRLRKSFQREAETDEQHKDSGRSYINVREFLDELEVDRQGFITNFINLHKTFDQG